MYRVLLIIGGLLVGLLTALFTVPVFIDWTRYRGVFEEEASRMIGRDVRVAGRVNLRFLPTPFLRFEKIRVTDTQSNIGEPLFRAEDFTVWLAVGALFRGAFEATEVELRRPALTLVMNDKGGGNWTALGGRPAAATFLPSSVKLDTMRVTNGSIVVFGPKGEERSRFERINGEVSAEALTGPYRVAAAFATGGRTRDIRLSTAAAHEDGSFRLKGTVRAPEVGARISLDGSVFDLMDRVRLEGELTAKLPVPAAVAVEPAPSGGALRKAASVDEAAVSVIDLKSPIKADTATLEFTDLALSFEQGGQPQLASGKARIDWRERLVMQADLQARWLDFDRLAGPGAGSPIDIARQIVTGLDDVLPASGRATLKLEVEQATLGGDVVSRLTTTLERTEGALAVKAFSVAMPGGTRVQATGVLSGRGADTGFAGDVNLRGASLTRFMAWAARPPANAEPQRDGPFALSGHVDLSARSTAGRGLTIHFAGSTLTGDASFSEAPNRRLSLVLEGAELDVTPLLDGASAPAAALQALTSKIAAIAAQSEKAVSGHRPDVLLRLRLGRLIAGSTVVRDVATDIRLTDGHLSMPLLRLGRDESWFVELRGDVADFMKPGAKGTVSAVVSADTTAGLSEVTELLARPFGLDPEVLRSPALLPLRVAGRVTVGGSSDAGWDMTIDGSVGAGRLSGSVRLDQAGATWRERRADVSVTLENPEAAKLIAQLLPDWAQARSRGATPSATRVVLRGLGTAKHGLASFVTLDTTGLSSELRGRLILGDTPTFEGDLRVQATDIGRALTALTGRSRAALDGAPAVGAISVAMSGGKLKLETGRSAIGSAGLSGKVELVRAERGWRIDGQVATDQLSLPVALSLLTEGRTPRAATATADNAPSLWSEDTFDLATLATLESRVRIDAGVLEVSPGVAIRAAQIDLSGKSGGLQIDLTRGEVLGGKVGAKLRLETVQGGARLAGRIELANGRLDQAVATGRPPLANGAVTFHAEIDGTAPNPRGLVSALRGKGEVALTGAHLLRFSPAAVREVTEDTMTKRGETVPTELRRRLAAIGSDPQRPVPFARTLAIAIQDSSARLAPLIIDTPEGRVTGATTIDLDGLRLDSEWRVEARGTAGRRTKAELAPITWVWAGPIARLDSRTPRLESEALEQDVTVRRMEREVDELERVRRQDEEAGRAAETERLRRERERSDLHRQWLDQTRSSPPPVAQPPPAHATSPAWARTAPPDGTPPATTGAEPALGSAPAAPPSVRGPSMEPLPPVQRYNRP